uniref:Protein CREG1-like n=1 Tax=Phallusia mammillata TaxID=59560 RepID=A0A6F9D9E5_9ASCI|nr:protein CREG1-like [Phallusia mammillata]
MSALQSLFFCGFLLLAITFSLAHASEDAKVQFFAKNDDPPPHKKLALTARYVIHKSDWGIIGTTSTHFGRNGLPFTNIWSMADGPVDNSTGIPYFYVVPNEVSVEDMNSNNEASFTVSEIGLDYCKSNQFDAEDPRCARITLMGKVVAVKDPVEKKFALNALFTRHPEMVDWSEAHAFFPARMNIEMVWMLDFFGPGHVVPLKDYFEANPLA